MAKKNDPSLPPGNPGWPFHRSCAFVLENHSKPDMLPGKGIPIRQRMSNNCTCIFCHRTGTSMIRRNNNNNDSSKNRNCYEQ